MEEAFDETKEEWLDEVFGVESKMDNPMSRCKM